MTCAAPETPCLRKHIESNDTYYIDLAPKLGTSETVSSVTSITCSDAALTAANATVLTVATTITTTERDADGNTTTKTYVITIGGSTYTVTYAGLDATGNRGTAAFAKT